MEPIAVVGLAFRLPDGIEDVSSFWDMLEQGRNLMKEWPANRTNIDTFYKPASGIKNTLYSRGGYFMNGDPAAFDAPFFSITAHAGIPLEKAAGTNTAVYASSTSEDYIMMTAKDPDNAAQMVSTATSPSIQANRLKGVLVLVLKRISDAIRDGDTIRAVIRGTGSNQDGHTPTMPQPNQSAQEALIRQVYKSSNLSFESTRYVEAHGNIPCSILFPSSHLTALGTGTQIGDVTEATALGRIFRASRSTKEPLYM
ncbi:putative PKS/NRPS-like protein biosynthetic cluster [Paraconiothyrium brasiliense]|uniref:PKS/NRPS-like protein biosynthetic cluster n=1 Tax=Paraconiothyrium brasiliense TaxID=300254 RepID=A0ABR3RGQ5_9PLEO